MGGNANTTSGNKLQFHKILPCPNLRPYIRYFWILKNESSGISHVERVLPNGSFEFIIDLKARNRRIRHGRQLGETAIGTFRGHVQEALLSADQPGLS